MYLIDTDIIIYSLKGNPIVQKKFEENAESSKFLSIITYGELYYGALKSSYPTQNLTIVRQLLETFPTIEITHSIIETYAGLRFNLEKEGLPLDDLDLIIAATAITGNMILITNNEKHFRRIENLNIENWSKQSNLT